MAFPCVNKQFTSCTYYTGEKLSTEDCELDDVCPQTNLDIIIKNFYNGICALGDTCKIRISENDECCDYLSSKLISTDDSITLTPVDAEDDDGNNCQTLDLSVNFPVEVLVWHDLVQASPFTIATRFQYSKDSLGNVYIRGAITGTDLTAGTYTFGTLPTGFYDSVYTDIGFVQSYTSSTNGFYVLGVTNTGDIFGQFPSNTSGSTVIVVNMQFNIS